MGYPIKITKDDCTSLSDRGRKRFGKVYRRSRKNEDLLPKDVLVSIFARVASASFKDLFNAKLSCTDFLEATNDEYIYEFVSLDKFPIYNWGRPSNKAVSFLTRCIEKGNAEALFRHGMTEYFKQGNIESGLEFLKRASEKKYLEATYVYGILLLSHGDKSSKRGLELLNGLKSSTSRNWNVKDCRDRIKFIIYGIWINHPLSLQEVHTKCRDQDHDVQFRKMPLDFATNHKISSCNTCTWYRELMFFCKAMNVDLIITK